MDKDKIFGELRTMELLKDAPDEQLRWLIDNAKYQSIAQGEKLFKRGDCIDQLTIVLKGRFNIRLLQGNQYRHVGFIEKHEITGALPYSRAKVASGTGEALMDSQVLGLSDAKFPEMIKDHHALTTCFVHVMSSRIRQFTKLQQQNEKMMALGKLSAGLAHELNNPSSAVVRGAQELKKHLSLLPEGFKKVISIRMDEEMVDAVNELLFDHLNNDIPKLSMMERTDLQYEIEDWLDDHNMDFEEHLPEAFAEYNFGIAELDKVAEYVPEAHLEPVLNWMYQNMTTEKLVSEIEEASARINQLVGSVKSYTHMDQAPEKQAVDIREGIGNTLVMLNHKLKKGKINVEEQFDENLPKPMLFVSEMNQVWTNLIDNAIDAMEDADEKNLVVRTSHDKSYVKTEIQDSGKGIPEEELDSIFDPFFTTKSVGKGTGIGLDIVQQVVRQHNGTVSVKSKPGKTIFEVCIPIK
jgi:signal transduction histidine kinase